MAYLNLDNHCLQFCPEDIAYYREDGSFAVEKCIIKACKLLVNTYGFEENYNIQMSSGNIRYDVPETDLYQTAQEAFR